MTRPHPLLSIAFLWAAVALAQAAPERQLLNIKSRSGNETVEIDLATGLATATNGVIVTYDDAVLTADKASINQQTGDVFAEGAVFLQRGDQTWTGPQIHYNFITKEMEARTFRTGKWPTFAAGEGLHGERPTPVYEVPPGLETNSLFAAPSNQVSRQIYTATNAFIATDDYYNPAQRIRAREITIVPGKYLEARHATFYLGNVPVFFLPYYRRSLEGSANTFTAIPGYRSTFGPYLLTGYSWYLNEYLDGTLHMDWREKHGFGAGPDFDYHLGPYGGGVLKYYYAHDTNPGFDQNNIPVTDHNRQRLYFSYEGTLRTNLTVKAQVAYQSDNEFIRDFFESEYRRNIQPNTFTEVNQAWRNWSLDVVGQPRVNDFFETVERLPDVRLSGFRQQIGNTPLYYESESTVGYYRRLFAETNSIFADTNALGRFSASRADTFHQITLPQTYFDWLNVTPRVGGRFTYYSAAEGPGAVSTEHYRDVFNTGAEVSTKISRTWAGVRNHFFDLDGVRHIIEPSVNYVYIPRPNVLPSQVPQFDYELTNSLRLLPLEFPEYNAIDSIDSQNVIRYGLRNRIQTKRNGLVEDVVDWDVYTDWRLKPRADQSTFSDIYSDLTLRPRSWLTLNSFTRYDMGSGHLNLVQDQVTLQPNNTWSWGVGYFYLRGGPLFGLGDNLITSTIFYRLNENWGFRTSQHFEARDGVMEEQYYTIYRDLRSWTTALTFRVRDNRTNGKDYTVAVTFSLKAFPRFGLGRDTVSASSLVGY